MRPLSILTFILLFFACKNEQKPEAQQFGKTGDPKIDGLTEQIFKTPTVADLYFQRAQLFFKSGNSGFDFAIKDMQYAMSIDSTNLPYYHFLSDVYLKYAQSRLAVATMEQAAAVAPTQIPTLLKLSEVYLITKQYGAALATLDKIQKQDPQNSDAYFLVGMILKEQNDTERAIKAFQKSADLNSDNKDAFIELGKLYTDKNDPIALKYFDNALLLDSLDFNAMIGKGYYFQTKKQTNEAIDVYKNILAHNPRYDIALFNLGLIYMDADSLDKANSHFNMVIQETPTFYKAYYFRGLVAEKKGDKNTALQNYKQALAFKSDYAKALEGIKRMNN